LDIKTSLMLLQAVNRLLIRATITTIY